MAEIGPGWVYVLSNEGHPGVQKIGFTTDTPDVRVASLNAATGVPHPFVVEFKVYVEECGLLESAVHQELAHCRVNPRREFFRISIEEAAECIAKLANAHASPRTDLKSYIWRDGVFQLFRVAPRVAPLAEPPPKRMWIVGEGGLGPDRSALNRGIIYQNGARVAGEAPPTLQEPPQPSPVLQEPPRPSPKRMSIVGDGGPKSAFNRGMDCQYARDYVEAYAWFALAASAPDPAARERAAVARDDVARLMTPVQIRMAQKLALEWKPEVRRPSKQRNTGAERY